MINDTSLDCTTNSTYIKRYVVHMYSFKEEVSVDTVDTFDLDVVGGRITISRPIAIGT